MANLSLRMLWFCLFAALVLNCSNYTFMKFYNEGTRVAKYYYPKTASGLEVDRSLISLREMYEEVIVNCNNKMAPMVNLRDIFYSTNAYNKTTNDVPEENYCPELPPGLGESNMHSKVTDENQFELQCGVVKNGGIYQPSTCRSRQSVAVIVAHRGCKKFLTTFLLFIHPFLMKQQLDYQIFVIEQSNNSQHFNRGMLLNVGFVEAQKQRKNGWDCILFHEPHILPLDSRNLYRCSWYPRQLAVHVERHVKVPYFPKFGGAVAMTPEQYLKANGFSNKYWGNDADFEDLYNRLLSANYFIENSLPNLGGYKTLGKFSGPVRVKSEYIPTVSPLYLLDGLTSLVYNVEASEARRMYTYIKVHIDDANETESYKIYDKLLNPIATAQIQIKATTTVTSSS